MSAETLLDSLAYKPRFPPDFQRWGIGIVGFGKVAQKWHLPTYQKLGLNVVGLYDASPDVRAHARQNHSNLVVFASLEELLTHPDIHIIDVATRPAGRIELIRSIIQADKHVLAQKPLDSHLGDIGSLLTEAEDRGLKVAVNLNGRWAPPWRAATLLLQQGVIGDVREVTHLYDTRVSWTPKPDIQGTNHFLLFDYSMHWIDITRCWLEGKALVGVRAQDCSWPEEGSADNISQSMYLTIEYADGSSAVIRGIACASGHTGHPFWIHGARGSIRGSVDSSAGDYLEVETKHAITRLKLTGNWFPDGFAGTIGELMCAISEDRAPYNSLAHNLLSFKIALAASESAEKAGELVIVHSDGQVPSGAR